MRYRFRDFLETYNPTAETPIGDFVRDALDDRKFPDLGSWDALELYLIIHNACPEAVEAARECWWHYQQARRLMSKTRH